MKIKSLIPLLGIGLLLTGCVAGNTSSSSSEGTNPGSQMTDTRILVAFFSGTGSTRRVAGYISEHLNAASFELTPTNPYTSEDLNYSNSSSRVVTEHNDPNRHVDLLSDKPENFDSYSVVFVGYPIWWGIAAWPINDFIRNNDFTGKTIIPFATSASSGLGNSVSLLKEMNSTGTWLDGHRFSSSASEDTVLSWVNTLEIK